MTTTPSIYDLTRSELCERVATAGFKRSHGNTIWGAVYRGGNGDHTAALASLPTRLREEPQAIASDALPDVATTRHSTDGFTRKDLLRLADGALIETVLMRFSGRATACVSTQVGCAMGCVFCASGQMGLGRNLSAGEIVAQAVHVDRLLSASAEAAPPLADPGARSAHRRHERLRNIVFMGMGEPLHNLDAVLRAIEILTDPSGLSLAARKLTLSTVGVIPGIRRLIEEASPVNLAVSLHGATQQERAALVPVARKWQLDELMDACREYTTRLDRRIFFEWTLIAGENDTSDHAHAVGQLLEGMSAQVNLIPLNPTAGFAGGPSERARAFQDVLAEYGLPSTVRQRRGIDIAAGCGQLAGSNQ